MTVDRHGRLALRAMIVLFWGYLVLVHAPWAFALPQAGLDPSWMQVITHAAAEGWRWGRDIVFTFGPFGYVRDNVYHPDLVTQALAWRLALFAAFCACLIKCVRPFSSLEQAACLVVIVLAVTRLNDVFYFFIPLLAALAYFRRPDRVGLPWVLTLVGLAGFASLVKLSFAVAAVLVFVLMDLDRLRERTIPVFVLAFIVSTAVFYAVSGQDPADALAFVSGGLSVISGYSGAMALGGAKTELVLFGLFAMAALGLVAGGLFLSRNRSDGLVHALIVLASIGAYGFVTFKAGFVRHDMHSIIGWMALAAGAAAVVATRPGMGAPYRAGLLVVAVAALFLSPLRPEPVRVLVHTPAHQATIVWKVLTEPSAWAAHMTNRWRQARAAIVDQNPLPPVSGTVDAFPPVQSSVLAHGMDYAPRPSFQDYGTYTPGLLNRNRAFLASEHAPETILMGLAPIDGRYPALSEGPLWLDLMTRYRVAALAGEFAVLDRRDAPQSVSVGEATQGTYAFDTWIPVPDAAAVEARVTVHKTLLGKAGELLFRPFLIVMDVQLASGEVETYRFVPGIAESGFILSPRVLGEEEFAGLAIGVLDDAPHLKVKAFRLRTRSLGHVSYDDISVSLRPVVIPASDDEPLARDIRRKVGVIAVLDQLVASTPDAAPHPVTRTNDRVLAHPPVSLSLPVSEATRLSFGYGILPDALEQGETNGACFHVRFVSDAAQSQTSLWSRCVDPMESPSSRSEQHAEVALDGSEPGRLVFETDCRGDCSWDWAYWSDVWLER